jgi:hypothetical protein
MANSTTADRNMEIASIGEFRGGGQRSWGAAGEYRV